MSGIIYYAVGLVFTIIGGGFAWLFRKYRITAEEKATLKLRLEALESQHESLRKVADAQANPITDAATANKRLRARTKGGK